MPVSQLPVYFLSHTGPTQAFDDPTSIKFLAELGQKWTSFSDPTPNSILVLSGHWEGEHGVARVRTSEKNEIHIDLDTVQDIPEFQELPEYVLKLEYSSRGSPRLANRVLELLAKAGIPAGEETKRGIDHGVWGPFVAILPQPTIPIVQMSLVDMRGQPAHEVFAFHIKLGQALAELRREGVLIVGSGTAVHNLKDHAMTLRTGGKVAPYVAPFDALLDKVALTEHERERVAIEEIAQSEFLPWAHPSLDHILPFYVAIGAAGGDKARVLYKNRFGGLSETTYSFGEN
ncbi:hypothetical protein BGZ75_005785 [Mortierella antarctica]|nr:hypothetical protein BGZ67_001291 [Mortierella alpina]KAF9982762.1 hypothetical protein BGZ75_005785 [Mortierella antarctica]